MLFTSLAFKNPCVKNADTSEQSEQLMGESAESKKYLNLLFYLQFHLICFLYLFEINYSGVMEEEKPQDYQGFWDIYVKDQIDWLTSHYKKTDVSNHEQKIKQIQGLFNQLKDKIEKSKFNKDDGYFKKFAKLQKDKYYSNDSTIQSFTTKIITKLKNISKLENQKKKKLKQQVPLNEDEQQQSQISLRQLFYGTNQSSPFCQQYKELFYKNHLAFIKYLTKQRYSFQNIARHILRKQRKDNKQKISFTFIVEQGLSFGVGDKSYYIQNTLLLYIFMRDIANAIIQLQGNNIFNPDIAMRNIVLCNCPKEELNNPEYLLKNMDKIKFKIIDFDFAFFIDGQHRHLTEEIISKRLQVSNLQNDLFNNLSFFKQSQDFLRILDGKFYKQIHSKIFLGLIQKIIDKADFKFQIQEQYEEMIKQKSYKKLITSMNNLITGYKGKN